MRMCFYQVYTSRHIAWRQSYGHFREVWLYVFLSLRSGSCQIRNVRVLKKDLLQMYNFVIFAPRLKFSPSCNPEY